MRTGADSGDDPRAAAPLAGTVVVSFEQAVAAPYCTRLLADLGARVIKVERPRTGDFARDYDSEANGMATHFVWLNRNKESIVVDFKAAREKVVLEALLDRADVVVQNLAPGVARGLGIDAGTVVAARPSVVAVDISGYGTGGPLDNRRAYDLLVQAEAGSCAMTGTADAPAKPGIPIADVGAGLQAAVAILAALNARNRSGRGTAIQVSLFDSVTDLLGFGLLHAAYTGTERPPNGLSSPVVSPYGAYPTRDGRTVVLGTTNDSEWQRLSALLDRPDLAAAPEFASNPQRCERRAELDAAITAWTRTLDLDEICARADAAGIGNSEFQRVSDVVDHPQLVERGRWREVDSPVGPLRSLLPAFVGAGWPDLLNPVPALGEHTAAILAECGLSDESSSAGAANVSPVDA
ncbi:CaiB/BaiF CoA transferase family protein [Nocardia noduli]|uniref:CaiB/BaiF CoA transferase family protein n=1 Tax=Nocardia noduli TaxID=2815722 RepID=UPI001C24ADA6|nr:CaiB/BaiF CoA-transferase family protein [Nocardia noduli]